MKKTRIKKRFFLVVPIYIAFVLIFEVILGFGMKDIWDRLNEWGKQK